MRRFRLSTLMLLIVIAAGSLTLAHRSGRRPGQGRTPGPARPVLAGGSPAAAAKGHDENGLRS